MNDSEFMIRVYRYAAFLKKSNLTEQERDAIVIEFNKLEGNVESRAIRAVRIVLGLSNLTEEIRKSANLDNSRRLIQDLEAAAREWQAKKKS